MKIATLALLLLCCFAALAQKNEMSVLNNRFYFVFPESAKNTPGGQDSTEPLTGENIETRIVYDDGEKRLVFFAKELNIKTNANLEEKLNEESTTENPFVAKTLFDKDSVVAVLLTPHKFDTAQKTILLKSLVVQNPDGTLCRIDAYINQGALIDQEKFEQITTDVFATLRKGGMRLNLSAHDETYAIMGSKNKLQLKLPRDYRVTRKNGADFDFYWIKRVSIYDEKEVSFMIVNFGYSPSKISSTPDFIPYRKPDTDEYLMFHKGPWENYSNPASNIFVREQLFDDDEIEQGMKINIMIFSNNKDRIEEMSGIVKDLLIVYDPAHVK